ncbi:DNA cytosine methyltransferase [Mycobacteroides chelonae]
MCDRLRVPPTTNSSRRNRQTRPIAVDLFAGAGGLTLGFEQAGFDIVAAAEYDPVHAATHLFNFPQCEMLCRNIANLSGAEVLSAARKGFERMHPDLIWPGRLDAIVGGPPCQGFSSGGKREEGDERNELLLEFVRLVEEIQPRTLCLENVAGLLEGRFTHVREVAFNRLRDAGYELSGTESTVNSLRFAVPQMRRRVVVLGAREGGAPGRPRTMPGEVSVADALSGLPSPGRYEALFDSDEVRLDGRDFKRLQSTSSEYARYLVGLDPTPGDRSRPRQWERHLLTGSRRTRHEAGTVARFKLTEPASVEARSRLYRLPVNGPARTLRAGTGAERGAHTSPRPIHPLEDRVITVREAARLHGYPDWFRFHTTNWHGHRQVGNSVPPPLARAAARVLLECLSEYKPLPLRAAVMLGDPALLWMSRTAAKSMVGAVAEEMPATRSRRSSDPADNLDAVAGAQGKSTS